MAGIRLSLFPFFGLSLFLLLRCLEAVFAPRASWIGCISATARAQRCLLLLLLPLSCTHHCSVAAGATSRLVVVCISCTGLETNEAFARCVGKTGSHSTINATPLLLLLLPLLRWRHRKVAAVVVGVAREATCAHDACEETSRRGGVGGSRITAAKTAASAATSWTATESAAAPHSSARIRSTK